MKNKLIKHFIKQQQPTDNTQGVLSICRIRPDDTHTTHRTHTRSADGLRMENLCKLYFIQIRNCALITLIIVICGVGGWTSSLDARTINIEKVFQQQQKMIITTHLCLHFLSMHLHTEKTSNSFFISISLSYASMQRKTSAGRYYSHAKKRSKRWFLWIHGRKILLDNSH